MLTLDPRNCAFVNFTNLANAIKAIDAIKAKPEYANLRISHGKDRCANPPRQGPQGGSGGGSGGGRSGRGPMSAISPSGPGLESLGAEGMAGEQVPEADLALQDETDAVVLSGGEAKQDVKQEPQDQPQQSAPIDAKAAGLPAKPESAE
jgi:hypothetical protein